MLPIAEPPMSQPKTYTAFQGPRTLVAGAGLAEILAVLEAAGDRRALVFDDATGDLVKPGPPPPTAAPTFASLALRLLPRHMDWLQAQPGGASAAVRRLIDAARRSGEGAQRQAADAAYRFISMVAGDFPGFEAATRALFAGDAAGFAAATAAWPADLGAYAGKLAQGAFAAPVTGGAAVTMVGDQDR